MTEGEPADPGDPFVRYGPSVAMALVVLALVLRAQSLGEYWLNPDEGIYYSTLTRHSFSAFWAEVSANAHPPLFYLLLRAAGRITWSFVMLRGISVFFGVAAVWAFWLVGRELGGQGRGGVIAGLVSAGLLAVNADAIVLSQVIRPYVMVSALLAGALYHLLRYRTDPSTRRLALYTVCVVAGLLVHYSAVLAFASFCVVVAYYRVAHVVERGRWLRLAVAQVVPAAVFAGLYAWNLGRTIDSDLMGDALGAGGWLSGWLVTSPSDVWHSFTTFQVYHLPPGFRGRSALLLLAALGVACFKNRLVAVVGVTGLLAALSASALGLYPFGPTRHDTWLVVFTLPAVGWLVGHVVEQGRRASGVLAAALALGLILGRPAERVFGPDLARTNVTEERVVTQRAIAPLVVRELEPDEGPRLILMSEESYNLLVPLYADRRDDVRVAPDSSALAFSYGTRTIVVARRWDWDNVEQLEQTLADAAMIPGVTGLEDDAVLVIAGGWGSELFPILPQLQQRGVVLDAIPVTEPNAEGIPVLHVLGLVLDRAAMDRR